MSTNSKDVVVDDMTSLWGNDIPGDGANDTIDIVTASETPEEPDAEDTPSDTEEAINSHIPKLNSILPRVGVSDGEYTPLGDEGCKFKYNKFPKIPLRVIDRFNHGGETLGYPSPDAYWKWILSVEGNPDNTDWVAKYEEEKKFWADFVSNYQFTDPNQDNFIDLNDPYLEKFGDPNRYENPYIREEFYDQLFEAQRKNNARKKATEEYLKNPSARIDDISDEIVNKRRRANKEKTLINPENKDQQIEARAKKRSEGDNWEEWIDDALKIATTPLDLFDIGLDAIKKHFGQRIEVVYTGEGDYGGLEFGILCDLPWNAGLRPPSGAKYYKSMRLVDRALMSLFATADKEVRNFWLGAFTGDAYKSSICKFARLVPDLQRTKTTSIDGNIAFKVVPPKDWFSPEIQAIDPVDLISILPNAEADTFLLHVGRVALGVLKESLDNLPPANKVIELPDFKYSYRSAVLLHGDPGTGKSHLLEYLIKGFSSVGYTFDFMGTQFNQFGWNVILNDLVVCDDLNERSIKLLLCSDKVKSAISGNSIQVENKGVDGRKMMSKASFFFSTNHLIFPENFDIGVANRFHFLQTYSQKQLLQRTKKTGLPQFVKEKWEMISANLGVPTTTLALYLIRCGLDKFIASCDLHKNEAGKWEHNIDKVRKGELPGYVTQMEANRQQYVFKAPIDDKDYLTECARKAFVFTKTMLPNLEVPIEFDDSFNAFTLRLLADSVRNLHTRINFIKQSGLDAQHQIDFLSDALTWILGGQKKISFTTWLQFVNLWDNKVGENLSLGSNGKLTFESIWDMMISQITTIAGASVSSVRKDYEQYFLKHQQDSMFYETQLEDILIKHNIDVSDAESIKPYKSAVAKYTSFDLTEVL